MPGWLLLQPPSLSDVEKGSGGELNALDWIGLSQPKPDSRLIAPQRALPPSLASIMVSVTIQSRSGKPSKRFPLTLSLNGNPTVAELKQAIQDKVNVSQTHTPPRPLTQ